MRTHRERETKLEVGRAGVLADLTAIPGVSSVERRAAVLLEAVYYDTADLALARAHTTLRRRTGGGDAGWHLKIPVSGQERLERHAPLGSAVEQVPEALRTAARARIRRSRPEPTVVVCTQRTVYLMRDQAGRVLAEVADDAVTSRPPDARDAVLDQWREWEVELVDGDPELLAATTAALRAAGGTTPGWPSKYERALGDRLSVPRAAPRGRPDDGSAGAFLGAHLRTLRENLLAWDPQVRLGVRDSVHQMRVVTRQLRGALASFGPLLTGDRVTDVRGELRWLAEVLGAARDLEVTCARTNELVASQPVEDVGDAVGSRLATDCRRARRTSRSRVRRALGSERYLLLLDALDALADEPPLTAAADASPGPVLARFVRHDARRVARAWRAAWAAPAGPVRDERLHQVRRAAKRVRYAAEAAGPTTGRPVVKLALAAKDLQTLLGDHHDSVEVRGYLRRLCSQAESAGESGFAYGLLAALELARADGIEAQLPAAWERFERRRRQLHTE